MPGTIFVNNIKDDLYHFKSYTLATIKNEVQHIIHEVMLLMIDSSTFQYYFSLMINITQTLRQRQANEIFARREAVKRGKLRTEKSMSEKKARISIYWVCKFFDFSCHWSFGNIIKKVYYILSFPHKCTDSWY
ncbi:hypothetical protein PCK1_002806 [Pneumocystis canis]|nr:hypothetical protein PCK1_002806 [Pneumocystis canis]